MPNKYALIIGNTEYSDAGLAQLNAPGKDAKDFARVLNSPDAAAFDNVVTLVNENSSNLKEAIEDFFTGKKPDDMLVFYFSGHGVRDESGLLYLAVKNTNRSKLRSTAVEAEFVSHLMDQSRSRRQVIILDCCNSGSFAQGTKAETGGAMGIAKTFEGTGYGRIVLTATDATQFAWEGDKIIGNETTNSLFTHFLVKGLEGAADEDGDGKITVDNLYDYAYEQIVMRTPKQTPGKWSYKQQGELTLRDNLKPQEVKPAPLFADLLKLLSHPDKAVRKTAIQDLKNLLNRKFLGLIRAADDKLSKIVTSISTQKNKIFKWLRTLVLLGILIACLIMCGEIFVITSKTAIAGKNMIATSYVGYVAANDATATAQGNIIATAKAMPTMIPIATTTMTGADGATLVYIPAGEFTMGSDYQANEEPIRKINLAAFWIDQTEVTNAMYIKCVSAGVCQEPADKSSSTRSIYYGSSNFDNYPVIYVNWNQAKTY
jgi:hypothetical protein